MSDINISVGLDTNNVKRDSADYIKSLDNIVNTAEKAEKQVKDLNKALRQQAKLFATMGSKNKSFNNALNKTASSLNKVSSGVSRTNSKFKDLSRTLRSSVGTLGKVADKNTKVNTTLRKQQTALSKNNSLWRAAKNVALAYIGINTAKNVIDTVSAFDSLNASMEIVSGSMQKSGENLKFITAESRRLGVGIASSGKEFIKLSAAARGTSIEGKGVRDIFTGVAEASRALNLSADDTRGAFRAITQIMSKGTVQAEELRGCK